MNEIEKIDYVSDTIKETLEAMGADAYYKGRVKRELENSLELLKDLREPYLIAIKNKINSGQF